MSKHKVVHVKKEEGGVVDGIVVSVWVEKEDLTKLDQAWKDEGLPNRSECFRRLVAKYIKENK